MDIKIIISILACVLFLNAASAVLTMPPQKVNTCVNIPQVCATCTYVNISSIKLPDSSVLIINSNMGKNGVNYNYTFCGTNTLGTYTVTTCGDKDGIFQCAVYNFEVTPAGGPESNTSFFILIAVFAVCLLILSFIFKNYIFSFLSGIGFLICGVYGMIYGFGDITNLYTRMVAFIIIGFGGIITIISALDLISNVEGPGANVFEGDDD